VADLPENLPGDVMQNVVGIRVACEVPDVLTHRGIQAPQQLFESRCVAALYQQDQKNVVLLRGHREDLIPYKER